MMPGVGFAEMVLLVLVAIVVIGPKELPLMMRKFGRFTGKMRAMAFEFRQGFDELGRQAELDELRKEVANLKKTVGLEDLQRELDEDRANLERDVNSALAPAAPAAKPAASEPAQGTEDAGGKPAAAIAAPAAAAAPVALAAGGLPEDDFQLDAGYAPQPPSPVADAAPETASETVEDDFRIDAGHKPPPVKQETPA